MPLVRLPNRAQPWPRRLLALLMLVLQVGVAMSPLVERADRRSAAHAEQRGTRHARTHNEETCAICGVRSLQATVAQAEAPATFRDVPRRIETAYRGVQLSRDPPPSNTSRAPPTLS